VNSNCNDNCQRIIELTARIKELEEKNGLLKYELLEMQTKYFGNSKRKKLAQNTEEEKPKEKKKLGAPVGHTGWFRKKPEKIDVIEEVRLKKCPHCGNEELGDCQDIEEHVQEDIILPKLKVTKYLKHSYWCNKCKKVVSGKGREELPRSYIGPQAKSVAGFLKYIVKVSDRDIKKIFKELCGLTIVSSSIPGFNNQSRRKCLPVYEGLKSELKKAPYVHADETGCPVDGQNWWDWVFATTNICLHIIHESRGARVVEEILGKKYDGILLSDFFCAYNKLPARAKQRCLVHLLREIKKILECYTQEDSGYTYCQKLKELIQTAIKLSEKYNENKISEEKFMEKREYLNETLGDFQFPDSQKGLIKRLAKRLSRHKNEIFTFLDYKGLPYHNNFAEQLIRLSVLFRKITFGHRSKNGTLNHSILMSVLQTGKLNNKESIPLIKNILTCRDNNPSFKMCLSP